MIDGEALSTGTAILDGTRILAQAIDTSRFEVTVSVSSAAFGTATHLADLRWSTLVVGDTAGDHKTIAALTDSADRTVIVVATAWKLTTLYFGIADTADSTGTAGLVIECRALSTDTASTTEVTRTGTLLSQTSLIKWTISVATTA